MLLFYFLLIVSNEAAYLNSEFSLLLTVSALKREVLYNVTPIEKEIQIHYNYTKLTEEGCDYIALFSYDYRHRNTSQEPLYRVTIDELDPHGYLQTNVTFGRPEMPEGWSIDYVGPHFPGEHCLPFVAVVYRREEIINSECLKIRPTWMQDNKLFIENMDIRNMFIPGTHNSACYKHGNNLRLRDAISRYMLTQDQSVWNQLVYGIRYFDFRVGFYPLENNDTRFWINHDLMKVMPLAPVITEIRQFLNKAKHEIIIIDFHRFPIGFNLREGSHISFVNYLERELKDVAIPFTIQPLTLSQIWETNKRVIISYGNHNVAREKSWLWSPVKQIWANEEGVDNFKRFLTAKLANMSINDTESSLWAIMAHLTPKPLNLIYNPTGSLRQLAHSVNPKLISWCHQKSWWSKLRIVATDFFLESGVVDMAVSANVIDGYKAKAYQTT